MQNNYTRLDMDQSNNSTNNPTNNPTNNSICFCQTNRILTSEQKNEIIENIRGFYSLGILSFIIGLPTFCMGYSNEININRYVKVDGTVSSSFHANFIFKNIKSDCRFLTGQYCGLTDKACNNYALYNYPIGQNLTLYYDISTGYCRTENFVNNLFIVGTVFLSIFLMTLVICELTASYYKITKEDLENYEATLNTRNISSSTTTNSSTRTNPIHSQKKNLPYITLKTCYNDNCPICLDKMKELDTETNQIVSLKCGHCYHKKCIDEFFKKKTNNKCPVCTEENSNINLV